MSDSNLRALNDYRAAAAAAEASARVKELEKGGGGGDSGGMDTRITQLEADVGEIKGALTRLEPLLVRMDATATRIDGALRKTEIDLAELKGRVGQLPSTLQMIGFVLAVLAIAGIGKYFAGN